MCKTILEFCIIVLLSAGLFVCFSEIFAKIYQKSSIDIYLILILTGYCAPNKTLRTFDIKDLHDTTETTH